MVITKREAEALAGVFFALRKLDEMTVITNDQAVEYGRLCAAIVAGAPPKPEKKKSCAW